MEGFADPTGSPGYNKQLSQRRAENMSSYLTQSGISGVSLRSIGFGEARQVWKALSATSRAPRRIAALCLWWRPRAPLLVPLRCIRRTKHALDQDRPRREGPFASCQGRPVFFLGISPHGATCAQLSGKPYSARTPGRMMVSPMIAGYWRNGPSRPLLLLPKARTMWPSVVEAPKTTPVSEQ